MKLAFLTMVWRDYWLLSKWVDHNSQHVPKSQLYVINHGGDPKVAEIAAGCNVIDIPRDDVTIEFAPEPLAGGPARHLMCRIPGNIRLELIAPAV